MPKEERDLFKLDLVLVFFGDLDPNSTGLLFSDSGLEKPDLASLLDTVPEDIRRRVLLKIDQVHRLHSLQYLLHSGRPGQ